MKKILSIFVLAMTLFLGILRAEGARVQVSSTRIAPGQSLQVKITAEGADVRFPDLQKVAGYPVENLRRMNKIESRYENGKFTSKTQKILRFEIYPQKSLTIPAFTVTIDGKKYRTAPVKVEVSRAAANAAAGGFAIRMSLDKKSVYMGEPLLLTVDAVEPINGTVAQMQYAPPAFKDFFVKPLGGERQIRQGKTTIHRLQYLLVPKKAGRLRIEPASLRVGIRDLNAPSDPFGIFGASLKWISLRSDSPEVLVKPVPAQADLVGHFQVSAKVSKRKVKANEPVNYTLSIVGEGSLEDLSDPRFDLPGVTVYSDDAVVKSTVKKGHLYSRWSKKYVFISDRDFTIPAIGLTEFDYTSGKRRKLETPSFAIQVEGGTAATAPAKNVPAGMRPQAPNPEKNPASSAKGANKKENLLEDPAYYARKAYEEKAARFKWYLLGTFLAGMGLMFLILRLWKLRGKRGGASLLGKGKHYTFDEALKILYPHINDDPEVEETVRKLLARKRGEEAAIDRKQLDRIAAHYDREKE
ncbi:BatD family protein [Nitratifractor salsuginis]|uniref:Uncharacterized protein n=1 Tax=Nitratifractor salsuginis (strain DSM 16511 / JCM 12458 / E9I37-1) TaxID=749222 RepID=E6WZG9_NITSE|nr:BatD family protein [Nitratifractor salsuginis]ADV45549.1 hypothetical protein Nitsa_0278 [Nitratifractor salsuginis DSM 16511]